MDFNKQQIEFINYNIDKNISLGARFGSGKTTTILYKIKNLIENHKINPNNIILTTYTKNAGIDMKIRLKEIMGNKKINLYHIGTIDSLIYSILKKNNILKKLNKLDKTISIVELQKIILQNKNLLPKNIEFLIIDEANDINEYNFNLIKIFYKNRSKIIFVGDTFQNIYRFRGSNNKYLNNFKRYFKNSAKLDLLINYRCNYHITNCCNYLIKIQKKKDFSIPYRDNISCQKPTVIYKNGFYELINFIKKIIYNRDLQYHEIAILTYSNKIGKIYSNILNKMNIPNVFYESRDGEKREVNKINNKIFIGTIHKAKGLEYKIVFLSGFSTKSFDFDYNIENIVEKLNIIYTGFSRAKDELYILHNTKGNFKLSLYIDTIPRNLINNRKEMNLEDKEFFINKLNCILKNNSKEKINSKNKYYNKIKQIGVSKLCKDYRFLLSELSSKLFQDLKISKNVNLYKGLNRHLKFINLYQIEYLVGDYFDTLIKNYLVKKLNLNNKIKICEFMKETFDYITHISENNNWIKCGKDDFINYYYDLTKNIIDYLNLDTINNELKYYKDIKLNYTNLNYNLKGEIDVLKKSNNTNELIEIKVLTISNFECKKEYFIQVLLYIFLFHKNNIHINKCKIFNCFKGDLIEIDISKDFNFNLFEEIFNKLINEVI